MKKQELEYRLAETGDVKTTVEKTLSMVLEDMKKVENGSSEALRVLGEVNNFVKDALTAFSGMSQDEALKFAEGNLQKLRGWSQAEAERLKSRPQLLQERAAAFQSVPVLVYVQAFDTVNTDLLLGQVVKVGCWLSTTVTVKLQFTELLLASVTVQVTVVVPLGNT